MTTQVSPILPDSPTPEPPLVATAPGFLPPPPPPTDPLEPTTTVTTGERLEDAFDDEPADSPTLSSTTSRVTPSRVFTTDAFAELLGLGLGMGTMVVHHRLSPGDNLVWIADEEDTAAICVPLSRIIARRVSIADGAVSDLSDGIGATVGMAGYVMKNWRRQAEERAWLQQQAQNAAGDE
ncbi:MAG: hypothetical protein ACR2MO_08535 [Acidimicrobiales bacterium]